MKTWLEVLLGRRKVGCDDDDDDDDEMIGRCVL